MGEKGLGMAEGRGQKRTVLLGVELVSWFAAFGHATGQGRKWGLPIPSPAVRADQPFSSSSRCSPSIGDLFQCGVSKVPFAITVHLKVLQVEIRHP